MEGESRERLEEGLIHDVDDHDDEGMTRKSSWFQEKRVPARCKMLLVLVSVALNIALVIGVFVLLHETDDELPAPPPPPANSSVHACPFVDPDVSDERKDPGIDYTYIGFNKIGLCWRNFNDEGLRMAEGYQLMMDDFWRDKNITVYTGRALAMNVSELLPDTQYRFTILSADKNNTKNASITLHTHKNGYCGNRHDLQTLKDVRSFLADVTGDCVIKHLVSDHGAKDCIKDKANLTDPCLDCYLFEAKCTAKNCIKECLHSRWSDSCQLCNRRHCEMAMRECSGIPSWTGADLKHHPG